MKSSVFSRDLEDVSEMLGCFSSSAKEFQTFCSDGDSKTTRTHFTVRVQGTVKSP